MMLCCHVRQGAEGGAADCRAASRSWFVVRRYSGLMTRVGKKGNVCVILVGKLEGRLLFGIPGRRFEDNIKVGVKEMEW